MMGLRAADKIGLFQGVLTTGEGKIAILARGPWSNNKWIIPILFIARDYCRNK